MHLDGFSRVYATNWQLFQVTLFGEHVPRPNYTHCLKLK
jgi:hypothetical protein